MSAHNDLDAERLLQKYGNMVYKMALSQMKSHHDAEDVFQNVFLRIVKYGPQFENDEHEKAWIIRATINCCKDVFAKPWYKNTEEISENIPAPEEHREDGMLDLVRKLPEKYRSVIHLFYYEDMSVKDIAGTLGKQENTIKSLLRRAKKLLKDSLQKRGLHYEL